MRCINKSSHVCRGLTAALLLLSHVYFVGCGSEFEQARAPTPDPEEFVETTEPAAPEVTEQPPARGAASSLPRAAVPRDDAAEARASSNKPAAPAPPAPPGPPAPPIYERNPETRSLADLLTDDDFYQGADGGNPPPPPPPGERVIRPPMEVDEQRVAAAGVRKLQSQHLTLYTDIPSSPEVDELPRVFDQALPQWCDYFGLDPDEHRDFHLTGYAIRDRQLFRRLGLLPEDLPPFLHGYSRDREIWFYEKESVYYLRHLVIHEGTHGIMYLSLGGYGPAWYSEAMAELFGTHSWQDGKLTTRYLPQNKEEVPFWGRVKIIKDEYAANRGMTLPRIMQYGPTAHLNKEPYAWCWAAAMFLDTHPLTREKFRRMRYQVHDGSVHFGRRLYNELADVWPEVTEQWHLFVANMEYGYDLERELVQYKTGEPLPAGGTTVAIDTDRGWQSSGIRLEAGTRYEITAAGRYQVKAEPQIWWCEPNGVTIRYWKGKPLGMLLGAIRDDIYDPNEESDLVTQTFGIGLTREMVAPKSGTLYLRINDSPAELADNVGQLTVDVSLK